MIFRDFFGHFNSDFPPAFFWVFCPQESLEFSQVWVTFTIFGHSSADFSASKTIFSVIFRVFFFLVGTDPTGESQEWDGVYPKI